MSSDKRPEDQSTEEWLQAYDSNRPADCASWVQSGEAGNELRTLIYDTHRTCQNVRGRSDKGHAVLCFIDIETYSEIVAFFNVDIARQRGTLRGQSYKTGQKGQFFPAPRTNFRKFWSKLFRRPPTRWASAYKELKPRFRDLILTAPVHTAYKSNGKPYFKISNPVDEIRIINTCATTAKQIRDNI
jgi:hypothetical protein